LQAPIIITSHKEALAGTAIENKAKP